MNKLTMSKRAALMISVGSAMGATMAVTGLVASGAQAADTTVTPTGFFPIATVDINAHDIVDKIQQNVAAVTASVVGALGAVTDPGTLSVSDSSASVSSNTIKASATGNASIVPVGNPNADISLTASGLAPDDGIATLAGGFNFGDINASVSDNEFSINFGNFLSGSASVTNDSISAVANGNTASTVISGAVPNDFDSATTGSSTLTANEPITSDWLATTGSLSASTLQVQADLLGQNISNDATADDNSILLNIINTLADEATISSPVLDDNTIGATVAGNSSNATIDIQSGGNPTFSGTAVVTNGQINATDLPGSHISALNSGSDIIATIAADDVNTSDDIELQGALSVQGNKITSSAAGNQALASTAGNSGNQILLADGLSFAGAGTPTPGADTSYDSGAVTSTVAADLIIHNSQGNTGARDTVISAETAGAEVAAIVDDINGGSVTVGDNHVTSDARGNSATSALASGAGMPSFDGSAAVANQQTNFTMIVSSESEGDIYAQISDDDDTPDSQILVDGNSVESTTYGNAVTQSLTLDAVVQDLPLTAVTLTGGTDGTLNDGNVSSDGSLTVTNLQSNYNATISSRDSHNIYATASEDDTVDGSSIKLTNNIGASITIGSSASNALTLSGTSVGLGAGIASVQIAENLNATAESDGTVQANVGDLGGEEGSSVAVSGNLQRAIAYGGSVGNALSIDAETITADGGVSGIASTVTNTGGSLTTDPQPVVNAAYGVLNIQSLDGDVAATAIPASWGDDSAFLVTVDSDVDGSSVLNGGKVVDGVVVGGNALVAAAYGADATNAASLAVGNLDSSNNDFASVLNLTNVQEVSEDSSVSALIAGGQLAETLVDDDVTDSSVATSYNSGQALAYGNRAGNSVSVTSTNINTEADSFPFGIQGEAMVDGGVATTEASFSLNNVQSVAGAVSASLLNDPVPATATASLSVYTEIGDDVIDSAISSDGNLLSVGATGNRASNEISVAGTGLATTVALTNYQIDPTAISALAGIEGTGPTPFIPGDPPIPFNFDVTGTGLSHSSGAFTGGTLYIDTTGLTSGEIAYLLTQGWSNGGPSQLTRAATGYPATALEYATADEGGSFTRGATVPATADTPATNGTPNIGGVTISIGGTIDPSSVTVNDNTVSGSVTGNSATNVASLVGTDVADGSDHLWSYAVVDVDTIQADGDVMVVNRQTVSDGGDLNSEVYSTFAIDTNGGDVIDSSLEVDGNKQSSQAIANTADNSVTLGATNTAAGAALASYQDSSAPVSATSNMEIFAPVVSSGSSISMSDNANSALAVQNNANNTLTVDATNATFVSDVFPIDGTGTVSSSVASSYADHALLNEQFSLDNATATAVTTIYNDDNVSLNTDGLIDGSVDVSGNSTKAQAGGNLATNVADVSASASLTASAAVTNSQANFGTISASATTDASVTIDGALAAVDGSSITLGSNTTQAMAQGNAATNVLNYTAGATYGAGTGNSASSSMDVLAFPFSFNETVTAQAAVLNFQGNSGAVSASSTQASYLVALNTDAAPTVTNATVNVIGNAVSASAYGNQATNVITASALNTSQPTLAIGNYQTNSGPITASVTTVTYGVTSGVGAITGSSIGVNGNSITATAVGNSATSSIVTGH